MIEEKSYMLSNKHLQWPNAWRAMFWKKWEDIHQPSYSTITGLLTRPKWGPSPERTCQPEETALTVLQKEPMLSHDTNQWLISQNIALTSGGIRDNISWDKYEWLRLKNMNFDWLPKSYSYIEVVMWTFIGPAQKEVINLGIFQVHSQEHQVGGLQQSIAAEHGNPWCWVQMFPDGILSSWAGGRHRLADSSQRFTDGKNGRPDKPAKGFSW